MNIVRFTRAVIKLVVSLLIGFCGFAFAYTPSTFDSLLRTYVTDDGFVDYDAWSNNADDLARLQGFVDELAVYDPSELSGNEQLAFWINAYNALAVHEVLQRYPVDSIRPTFLGIPERSFFVESKHTVGGEDYNLDQIENEELRTLGEPRIHFAINCASQSCPVLLDEAYSASVLDRQLDEQARLFVNDPARNQYNVENNEAMLSKIFDWFEGDFDEVGGVATYLTQFAEGDALTVLQNDPEIDYLTYDWGLNRAN